MGRCATYYKGRKEPCIMHFFFKILCVCVCTCGGVLSLCKFLRNTPRSLVQQPLEFVEKSQELCYRVRGADSLHAFNWVTSLAGWTKVAMWEWGFWLSNQKSPAVEIIKWVTYVPGHVCMCPLPSFQVQYISGFQSQAQKSQFRTQAVTLIITEWSASFCTV